MGSMIPFSQDIDADPPRSDCEKTIPEDDEFMINMYSSRRGKVPICTDCGSTNTEFDYGRGEIFCNVCGIVASVEQIPALEKDSEGNLQSRKSDRGFLGSIVDTKSHKLQRKHQRFDGLEKYSKFESEMRMIIKSVYPSNNSRASLSALKDIMSIKRNFTKSYKKMTNTNIVKIPFFPTGGRSTGNHLPAFVLIHHYPKMLTHWNANIRDSIAEVGDTLHNVEYVHELLSRDFDKEVKRFVFADLKGLKRAWIHLSKDNEYKVPMIYRENSDIRETILKAHRSLFGSENGTLSRMIYSINQESFQEFNIHPGKQYINDFVFEFERLIRGCPRIELNESISTSMAPPGEVTIMAQQVFAYINDREVEK